jgi:hypothetical protein
MVIPQIVQPANNVTVPQIHVKISRAAMKGKTAQLAVKNATEAEAA